MITALMFEKHLKSSEFSLFQKFTDTASNNGNSYPPAVCLSLGEAVLTNS